MLSSKNLLTDAKDEFLVIIYLTRISKKVSADRILNSAVTMVKISPNTKSFLLLDISLSISELS